MADKRLFTSQQSKVRNLLLWLSSNPWHRLLCGYVETTEVHKYRYLGNEAENRMCFLSKYERHLLEWLTQRPSTLKLMDLFLYTVEITLNKIIHQRA